MGGTSSASAPLRRAVVGYAAACVGFGAVALWLAAPDEVVAQPSPYDQVRYLEMAEQLGAGRWLGPYGLKTLIREPAYPLWLTLVDQSGWRLRIAAEVLLAACACLFGAVWLRVGVSATIASAGFAVLVLQPHAGLVHRDLLPAGFYLPVLLLALSGLTLAAAARRPGRRAAHAAWAGLALGVLWTTRHEKELLAGLLLCALVVEAWARRRSASPRTLLRDAAVVGGAAALGIGLVEVALSAQNLRHYGVFLTSELESPGFRNANRALLSIAHDAPRRLVPVPADARARAYAASPAFAELRDAIEAPGWARNVSCKVSKVCDDLAGGVFLWSLREAAARTGHMRNAVEADAFLQRIADEIDAACERGALPCRRARLAFLHPYPGTWLPRLSDSFRRIARRMATPGRAADRDPPRDDEALSASLRERFDAVANREPLLTSDRWVEVAAYVQARDPVTRVALRTGAERSPLSLGPPTQADAAGEPPRIPFVFLWEPASGDADRMRLEIEQASGAVQRIPLRAALAAPVERGGLRVAVERLERHPRGERAQRRVRHALWAAHAVGLRGVSLAGLVAAALLAVPRLRPRLPAAFWVALASAAAYVAARVALLAVVDASSFGAATTRYLYPAISLTSCVMLLLVFAAAAGLRARRGGA